MIYLKATIVGLSAGLLLAIAVEAVEVVINVRMAMADASGGIGSVAAGMEDAGPVFIVGFAAGFFWTVWQGRRRALGG